MATIPAWHEPSPETQRRLDEIARTDSAESDAQWARFLDILRATAAEHDGRVDPNNIRERLRTEIDSQRIGAFYRAATLAEILTSPVRVTWSTDLAASNRGKPIRTYRFDPDAITSTEALS